MEESVNRRERKREKKRHEIVDAAEQLFFSQGYPNTTMDQIAEKADLSKGAIYFYFKSKEEIFKNIMQRTLVAFEKRIIEAFARGENGIMKLYEAGKAINAFFHEDRNHFEILFFHHFNPLGPVTHSTLPLDESLKFKKTAPTSPPVEESLDEQIKRESDRLIEKAREIVLLGMRDGSIRKDIDPTLTLFTLHSMWIGLIRIASIDEEYYLKHFNISFESLVETAFSMIGEALEPHTHGAEDLSCDGKKVSH